MASQQGAVQSLERIGDERMLRSSDQLAVPGEVSGFKYYHHGIFLSFEEGVIDFNGADKINAAPRKVSLMQFTGGRPLFRVVYNVITDPPEVVIKRAKELYHTQNWGPFNLLKNNCEHFAVYCKLGKRYSAQVVESLIQLYQYTVAVIGALKNTVQLAKLCS